MDSSNNDETVSAVKSKEVVTQPSKSKYVPKTCIESITLSYVGRLLRQIGKVSDKRTRLNLIPEEETEFKFFGGGQEFSQFVFVREKNQINLLSFWAKSPLRVLLTAFGSGFMDLIPLVLIYLIWIFIVWMRSESLVGRSGGAWSGGFRDSTKWGVFEIAVRFGHLFLCGSYFLVCFFRWILGTHFELFRRKWALSLQNGISHTVIQKLSRLPPPCLMKLNPERVARKLEDDIKRVSSVVVLFYSSLGLIPLLLFCLVLQYRQVGTNSIICLSGYACMVLLDLRFSSQIPGLNQQLDILKSKRNQLFDQIRSKASKIKLSGLKEATENKIEAMKQQESKILKKILLLKFFSTNLTTAIACSSAGFTLFIYHITSKDLSLERVYITSGLIITTIYYLKRLREAFSKTRRMFHSLRRINKLLRIVQYKEIEENANLEPGALEISQADYSWDTHEYDYFIKEFSSEEDDQDDVHHSAFKFGQFDETSFDGLFKEHITFLEDINLKFKPGQITAIIGEAGSGKSCIFEAILGNMTEIDGNIIKNGSIALVSQKPFLLNDSLRNNITFGKEFDQRLYDNVIRICELDDDLLDLPFGDKTRVGTLGISLNQGQMQRVSIARALYSESQIYLIDDCFSDLAATQRKETGIIDDKDSGINRTIFSEAFLNFLSGKTRIMVVNNQELLSHADQVVLMDDGKVVRSGSLEEVKTHKKFIKSFGLPNSSQNVLLRSMIGNQNGLELDDTDVLNSMRRYNTVKGGLDTTPLGRRVAKKSHIERYTPPRSVARKLRPPVIDMSRTPSNKSEKKLPQYLVPMRKSSGVPMRKASGIHFAGDDLESERNLTRGGSRRIRSTSKNQSVERAFTNFASVMTYEESRFSTEGKEERVKGWGLIFRYVYRGQILGSLGLFLISSLSFVMGMGVYWWVGGEVDKDFYRVNFFVYLAAIWVILGGYLAMFYLSGLLTAHLIASAGERALKSIIANILDSSLLNVSQGWYGGAMENHPEADKTDGSSIIRDLDRIDDEAIFSLQHSIFCLSQLLGSLVSIALIQPLWAAIAVVLLIIWAFVSKLYLSGNSRVIMMERTCKDTLLKVTSELVQGRSAIQIYGINYHMLKRWGQSQDKRVRLLKTSILAVSWLEFVSLGAILTALYTVVLFLLASKSIRLSYIFHENLNSLVLLIVTITYIDLPELLGQLAGLANSAQTILKILTLSDGSGKTNPLKKLISSKRLKAAIEDAPTLPSDWPDNGDLQIENLSYKNFHKEPILFENLTLDMKSRQNFLIKFRTQELKKSFISVFFGQRLLKALKVSSKKLLSLDGMMTLDGVDLSKIGFEKLASVAAVVHNEPYLFEGTLRDNLDPMGEVSDKVLIRVLRDLTFWKGVKEAEIAQNLAGIENQKTEVGLESARIAGMIKMESRTQNEASNLVGSEYPSTQNMVLSDSQKLKFRISAGGVNLSDRQTRLLELARVAIRRPRVVLIESEVLADLDVVEEDQLDANLSIDAVLSSLLRESTTLTLTSESNPGPEFCDIFDEIVDVQETLESARSRKSRALSSLKGASGSKNGGLSVGVTARALAERLF